MTIPRRRQDTGVGRGVASPAFHVRPVLDRRTFLRASGVALALPMLESMSPALARAAVESPRRMVTICCTLGLYSDSWFPKTAGAGYDATEYLRLIDEHRSQYTLFSGLSHEEQGRAAGAQLRDHLADGGPAPRARWLPEHSVARPGGRRPPRVRDALSVDRARDRKLPKPVVQPRAAPWCRPKPAPPTCSGSCSCKARPTRSSARALSLEDGGSILDQLKAQASALRRQVSTADQRKLDAYFHAVRTVEQELGEVKAWQQKPKPVVDARMPPDLPDPGDLIGRIKAMFGLIPLIIETDSSRVVSVMIQDHGTAVQVAGVNSDQHNLVAPWAGTRPRSRS